MPNLELITRNRDGLKNFYDEKGCLYFENWLLQATESSNQMFRIQRSEDSFWNFISKNGSFLTDEWFELLGDFVNGYAFVKARGRGCNYIDEKGHFVCRTFYDEISMFNENGFAVVKKNGKYNAVSRTGKLVFRRWYKEIECDFGVPWRVRDFDGKWSAVNSQMKFITRKWYEDISPFVNGFAKVKRNERPASWNYIGEDGKMLSRSCFETVEYFYGKGEMARVQRKSDLRYNYIRRDGTFISDTWYAEAAISAYNGWALIQRVGDLKYNYVNKDGELISETWFTEAYEFKKREFALVCNDENKWNYIMFDARFIFNKWYDKVEDYGEYAHYRNEGDLKDNVIFFSVYIEDLMNR